jgi:hypothetical protein
MPKRSGFDEERLRQVLRVQHQVIARRQALLCGMPHSTLDRQIAPGGPWQRLLPGVYLAVTGTVTQDQREMAALLYAGPRSLITGPAAVRRHRLSSPGPDLVDVLIPWSRQRQSTGFVRMHRTRRMPDRGYVTGKIWFTKPPRAVADAARSLTRFDDVRHVVCAAVQNRLCTVAELTEELQAGPARDATLFREALAEIGDGIRSVAEGDLRVLILDSDLPKPMFNAQLFDADGVFIATVDDWWPEAGVAGEVDSRAYHLSADDQDRTTERHDRLIARGIFPLHFSPKRIKTDPAGIIRDLRSAIEVGRRRPPLPITALPAPGSG